MNEKLKADVKKADMLGISYGNYMALRKERERRKAKRKAKRIMMKSAWFKNLDVVANMINDYIKENEM